MRTTVLSTLFASSLALGALSIAACEGRVEPGTGGGSSGSLGSSGSVGSSGSESSGSSTGGFSGSGSSTGGSAGSSISGSGDPPDCSKLGVPDVARICPDGSSVGGSYVLQGYTCVLEFPCPPTEPSGCGPGGACSQGESCGSAASSGCGTVCMCDSTNHYVCDTCVTPPSDPCSQGAICSPGTGCATSGASAGASSNCGTTCMCDSTGIMQCTNDCAGPPPPPPPDPCAGYSIPNTCEVCSDGTTQCEHFSVINGQCAIEICPGKAPVMMPIPLK